jgi:hypothetical protein
VSELVDRSERERAAQRNSGEPPASLVPRYEAQVAEAMQHKRAMHALLAHAGIAVDKYRCDKLSKYHIVVQHMICTPLHTQHDMSARHIAVLQARCCGFMRCDSDIETAARLCRVAGRTLRRQPR